MGRENREREGGGAEDMEREMGRVRCIGTNRQRPSTLGLGASLLSRINPESASRALMHAYTPTPGYV